MKFLRRFLAIALAAVSTVATAQAPAFPDPGKPLRFVVPFGAGSGIDLMARAYGRAMAEQAGVNAVVDNKPGAEGVIGIEAAKIAAPDGYTLLWGNLSTHVLNAHMLPSISYDPLTDFIPVAATENVSLVINAGPSTKFATLKEAINAARANPGKLTFGSGSASTRLCMEMLEHLAGIKLMSVPYKTQAQAAAALAGGEIDFLVTDVPTAVPFYNSGRLRPLASTGRSRLSALPNVPTAREQGVADYDFSAWHAVFVPARTPAPVIEKLQVLLRNAARSKYATDVLTSKGSDAMNMDSAQLSAMIKKDLDGWGQLLRDMKKNAR